MKINSIIKTIDGDTIVALIELEFNIIIRKHIRLYGIDCPEKSTIAGKKVKSWIEKVIRDNFEFLVLEVIDYEDKYGRLLAKIKIIKEDSELDLSEELIKEGLAKTFYVDILPALNGGAFRARLGKSKREWKPEELYLIEDKLKEY